MIVVSHPPLLLAACPGTRGEWFATVALAQPGARSIGDSALPAWAIAEDESLAPLRAPTLLRAGLVRDPWSWYAETWLQALQAKGPARDAVRAWGRGSTVFRDFLYGATHPETVLDPPVNLGVFWTPRGDGAYAGLVASTLGLCSFSFLYHYGTREAWQRPTERPAFAVDVLVDGNDAQGAMRTLLGLAPDAPLPPVPGPPAPTREAMRLGYDREMARWVVEADRPIWTVMRYGPWTTAGNGRLFPVRSGGAVRKEPVVPLPGSVVDAMDRDLVAQLRAASARRSMDDAPPVLPKGLRRLKRWVESPA